MCIAPSYLWIERGPEWVQQPVKCKVCWQCRSNRVSDYVGRSLCEAAFSDWTVAVTLTYRPSQAREYDLAHKIITPSHFQEFIRSLRKRGHSIRYLVAGEYGELRGRAHFHAVLFGKGPRPEFLENRNFHHPAWPHGHMWADWSANDKALRYVCKYVLKNEKGSYWFSLSKKPAIGTEFFYQKAAQCSYYGAFPTSFKYLPPNGDRSREYMLTGAVKRDFVGACLVAFKEIGTVDKSRLNEWVAKAVTKYEYDEAVKAAQNSSSFAQILSIARNLRANRPTKDAVRRSLLDIEFNLTD